MECSTAITRRSIGHIVLRLVLLAIVAEQAAQRSLVVRRAVAVLLCRAEFAAVSLFLAGGQGAGAQALFDAPLPPPSGDSAALVLLAGRFRAMAAMLAVVCRALAQKSACRVRLAAATAGLRPRRLGEPPVCDTS